MRLDNPHLIALPSLTLATLPYQRTPCTLRNLHNTNASISIRPHTLALTSNLWVPFREILLRDVVIGGDLIAGIALEDVVELVAVTMSGWVGVGVAIPFPGRVGVITPTYA